MNLTLVLRGRLQRQGLVDSLDLLTELDDLSQFGHHLHLEPIIGFNE